MRATLLAVMAVSAAAAVGPAQAATTTRIAAAPPRAGWFVCDAVRGPWAAFAGTVTEGRSTITLLDRRNGRIVTQSYAVGAADHGAGNVFWALSRGGREVGAVRGINPGMVAGSEGIAPIKQLRLGARTLDCRWLGHLRFLGLDARRGATVTAQAGRLVYRSYDFARRGPAEEQDEGQTSNAPTLEIVGGREDARGFRFDHGGFTYAIERPQGGDAGAIRVTRGDRQLGIDRLVGSSWWEPEGATALGPDAVWDGAGLDGCRRHEDQAALRACVADRMRAARVSAAGIAFSMRTMDGLGYVSGWRQAGPVGIATLTYPFRANTNTVSALVARGGAPIFVDAYRPTAADAARADYRALLAAHPGAVPIAPGEVSMAKIAPGAPVTIRVRTRLATCHACAAVGAITIAYTFDAQGRLIGSAMESAG